MRKLVIVVLLLLAVFSFIGAYTSEKDALQQSKAVLEAQQKDSKS